MPRLHGSVSMRVSALGSSVELHAPKDAKAIAKKLSRDKSELCPSVKVHGAVVVLHCQTRRFDAALIEDKKSQRHLELRALRGIPWRHSDEGPPQFAYPPQGVGLGGACPGTTLAGQAECERQSGHSAVANRLFTEALNTADVPAAALRLGDLALLEQDPVSAARWFQRAGTKGAFGRMAMARLCELTGSCLQTEKPTKLFDAVALPEPLRTELELRAIRVDAFLGKLSNAARALGARISDTTREVPACAEAAALCAEVLRQGLQAPDSKTQTVALEAYLQLRQKEPLSPALTSLSRAAAEAAYAVGAPQYGANLLASLTQHVPSRELDEHLRRTVEMYLEAGDTVRAEVIIDFANARLGTKRVSSRAWRSLLKGTRPSKTHKAGKTDPALLNELTSDCQQADALLAKSRAFTSSLGAH